MALGCGLTSVRGDREEDIKEKHLKKSFLTPVKAIRDCI
jgi:hypothetical protein